MHVIFNGVDPSKMKLNNMCEYEKEIWDIIQTTYGGNCDVKYSKLLMLTTRFEELCMLEDELLSDFYSNIILLTSLFHLETRFLNQNLCGNC